MTTKYRVIHHRDVEFDEDGVATPTNSIIRIMELDLTDEDSLLASIRKELNVPADVRVTEDFIGEYEILDGEGLPLFWINTNRPA